MALCQGQKMVIYASIVCTWFHSPRNIRVKLCPIEKRRLSQFETTRIRLPSIGNSVTMKLWMGWNHLTVGLLLKTGRGVHGKKHRELDEALGQATRLHFKVQSLKIFFLLTVKLDVGVLQHSVFNVLTKMFILTNNWCALCIVWGKVIFQYIVWHCVACTLCGTRKLTGSGTVCSLDPQTPTFVCQN